MAAVNSGIKFFYPEIEGAYVDTKIWHPGKADKRAGLGEKYHSAAGFLEAFGRSACGRKCIAIRQKAVPWMTAEAFELTVKQRLV